MTLAASPVLDAEETGSRQEKMETMTVTGTRTEKSLVDVPVSISVQEMDLLMAKGFTYGTDEFRGIPGISFRRGEGDGDAFPFVSFRGSTGTEGYLALIDGIPFMGVFESAPLDQIPYSVVDRVEIAKGPGSTLYGRGAVYGLTNYITRAPDRDESRLSVSGGSNGYWKAQGSVSRRMDNDAGLLIDLTREEYDGWREKGGFERTNLFAKYAMPIGDASELTFYANYYDVVKGIPNGIPLDNDGNLLPVAGGREAFLGYRDPEDDNQTLSATAKFDHELSSSLSMSTALQLRRSERENNLNFYDSFGFNPAENIYAVNGFSSEKEQDAVVFDYSVTWLSDRHSLVAGVSADYARSDNYDMWSGQNGFTAECGFSFFLIEIDYTTGEIVNRDNPCFVQDLPYSNNVVEDTSWGVFVQDEIRLTDSLTATLGLRYDSFEREASFDPVSGNSASGDMSGDADAFSPRLALMWQTELGQWYFSYGRGFNSNFGDIFQWNPANYARPENKPTTIDSFELGWKYESDDRRLLSEIAVFQTLQKNRRQTVPNPAAESDYSQPSNLITFGQRYESQGIELSLAYELTDQISLQMTASHIEPEWDEYLINSYGTVSDLSGTTPVGVAENTVYFSFAHRPIAWLEWRASYEFYDDYEITQDNRVSGGQYDLLTLGLDIMPASWSGTKLSFTATNALDDEYYFYFGDTTAPTYATPGPERELRASLEFVW